MEKFHTFQRIVGAKSEGEKAEVLRFLQESLPEQAGLAKGEKEKTPEQLQAIFLANQITNQLREKYGLEKLDIPADNFRMVSEKEWLRLLKTREISAETVQGIFVPATQSVVLREQPSLSQFFHNALHETIHFKAYHAVQLIADDRELGDYRVGLNVSTRDGAHVFFHNLDEAVVEELTKRGMDEIFKNDPLFQKENEKTKEEKLRASKIDAAAPLNTEEVFYLNLDMSLKQQILGMPRKQVEKGIGLLAYQRERVVLNTLIDKLFEKNQGRFSNREEVFDIFVKGVLSGHILPIGRLVEKTFGKGAFRRIGELGNDAKSLEEFVNSL